MLLADRGYNDCFEFFETPTGENTADQRMKRTVRARHESLNARLKKWAILSDRYRNSLEEHRLYFDAIVHITQTVLLREAPLFQLDYKDY